MAYNEQLAVEKLRKLTNLQDSIQITSSWFIYHRRNFRESVATWFRELNLATTHHALNLMYLANDVLQNSRKRSPEFIDEFSKYLPDCYSYLFGVAPPDIKQRLARLVEIWETRAIFTHDYCQRLRDFARSADPNAFQMPSSVASSSSLLSSSKSTLSLSSQTTSLQTSQHALFKIIEESHLLRENAKNVKDFLDLPVRPHNEQFKASFHSAAKVLDSLVERQTKLLNSLQTELEKENDALEQYRQFKKQFQSRLQELGPSFTTTPNASLHRTSSPSPPPYQPSPSSTINPPSHSAHIVDPLPPAQLELLSTLLNTSIPPSSSSRP